MAEFLPLLSTGPHGLLLAKGRFGPFLPVKGERDGTLGRG